MNNNIFPGQHVTTTTVITSTETQVNPIIRFDRSYLNTLSGQLKLLEVISSCIALFFVSFSPYAWDCSACTFFETVAVGAVWWNTILLIFYLFHVIEKFYKIPWLKVEAISCVTFSALYFLAALLSLTRLYHFLFFFFLLLVSLALAVVFGYDAYLKLQDLQAGEIPQSVRVVSQVADTEQPAMRY